MKGVVLRWCRLLVASYALAPVLCLSATPGAASAQTNEVEVPQAPPAGGEPPFEDFSKPMGPADPFNRGTPRGSMYGFITAARDKDFERAAQLRDEIRSLEPA